MKVDYLIIGAGIAGTLLSYELLQEGKSVLLMDNENPQGASLVASAIINPLIAKNWTIAQDAQENTIVALKTFRAMELLLDKDFVAEKALFVFPKNTKEQAAFQSQIELDNPFIQEPSENDFKCLKSNFTQSNEAKTVSPLYSIDAINLLASWKKYLQTKDSYFAEKFDFRQLIFKQNKIHYKGIIADKIVFCEGAVGCENPFFLNQKFTKNRGDVLLISIPKLSNKSLYHRGIRLVPRPDGLWWCGSNYIWQYDNLEPNGDWRKETENELNNWLKTPFEIVLHLVAERPTTAGQLPILAQNLDHKNVYLFNGLGTRGFSVGASLAKKMVGLMEQSN